MLSTPTTRRGVEFYYRSLHFAAHQLGFGQPCDITGGAFKSGMGVDGVGFGMIPCFGFGILDHHI